MIEHRLERDGLLIAPVTKEDLFQIWLWYSDVERYKHATGLDKPITFEEMRDKYIEARCSRWEFFFKVVEKQHGIMLGVVKGRVHYLLDDEAWISSILIDEAYQGVGVGHTVVSTLEEYFRSVWLIRWLYTGVLASNVVGLEFWKSMGFAEVRKTRYQIMLNDRPEDIVIMAKNLEYGSCLRCACADL